MLGLNGLLVGQFDFLWQLRVRKPFSEQESLSSSASQDTRRQYTFKESPIILMRTVADRRSSFFAAIFVRG